MANGQQRGNRKARKPKKIMEPAAHLLFVEGASVSTGT